MTQEEILQYNKMCAVFLGAICLSLKTRYSYFDFGEDWGWKYPFTFQQKIHSNMLKFHSDWNWIMEVVAQIQLLNIVHDNTRSYDSVYKEWQCTFSPSYKTHDFGYIVGKSKTSEKEAVVQAINQFLIWYEKN